MRVAVLGLGFMGSTHLKALRSIPDAEIVAVYSSDERKLAGDLTAIQGNLGGPGERFDFNRVSKYHDIQRLLNDSGIDAVDICLPTNLHASVAIAALQSGKHVLVEKPMALDSESADDMIAAAERNKRVLMTAQVLRFFPMYEKLQELLSPGGIGPAHSAIFERRCAAPAWSGWLSDPAQSGGGAFDLLIHDVDMCLHLFGRPTAVSASGHEALESGVDLIHATLHYPGLAAVVSGGWHSPKSYPFSMSYRVAAAGGTLEYNSINSTLTLYGPTGIEQLPMRERDGYRAEIEYFLECCHTGASPEKCPPRESADAVAVMRRLLEARTRNGEKIECRF